MSNIFRDALTDALDFFFRRRPPFEALKWHIEDLPNGNIFPIPMGKIYEVFIYQPAATVTTLLLEDNTETNIMSVDVTNAMWKPASYFNFFDATDNPICERSNTLTQGYIFSEGERLKSYSNGTKIRWREVASR